MAVKGLRVCKRPFLGSLKMRMCTVDKTDLSMIEKHHAILLNMIFVAKCILISGGLGFLAVQSWVSQAGVLSCVSLVARVPLLSQGTSKGVGLVTLEVPGIIS